MDLNNSHNQSYWFVLREDQSNVIFSSNNFTIQNPQISGPSETRYIVDTGAGDNRQYIQINEAPISTQEVSIESGKELVNLLPKDDQIWDRNRVKLLLTLCLDNKFRNITNDASLWNEISLLVGVTPEECSKKYGNLKRTYLRLLKKKRSGKNIKWVHYHLCEEVFKYCNALSPANLEPWEDSKVRRLLTLYIDNLHRIRNRSCVQKDVWLEIASQLETTRYNCYHKFKNLKRTYLNWLGRSRETGKLSKWPYCNYFDRIFYNNYDPGTGPWNKTKIKQLIDAYSKSAHKFRSRKYQKQELWKEISTEVGESARHCDRKFRNLKQTYIRLKMKGDFSGFSTSWRYYKDFEAIFGATTSYINSEGVQNILYKCPEADDIKQMLNFYIANKDKFSDPLTKNKNLWKIIAPKLGITAAECDKKFRNLKQTYVRLAEKKRDTGKGNTWPYFCYFEKIYDEPKTLNNQNNPISIDDSTLLEIKRVVQNVQSISDNDKFEKLVKVAEESNVIQKERNRILHALLNRN